jgi:hypothetical protein
MILDRFDKEELRRFLIKNWMTHDALWYGEVAAKMGMAEASPMNLRVCRNLGKIELRRFAKKIGASPPQNMEELKELFSDAHAIFVPSFMDFEMKFSDDGSITVHTKDCFAHNGMTKAGLISEYECGIFERIEGWFDGMELEYTRTPDLSRCLKYKGEECIVTIKFNFKQKG